VTGIGRNTEQVRRLLKRVVVHSGHEDGIAPLRGDLDGLAVVIHLLDQRERCFLASLAVIAMAVSSPTVHHTVPVRVHPPCRAQALAAGLPVSSSS